MLSSLQKPPVKKSFIGCLTAAAALISSAASSATAAWTQAPKLADADDRLAINENTANIGSLLDDSCKGSASLRAATTGSQIAELAAPNAATRPLARQTETPQGSLPFIPMRMGN